MDRFYDLTELEKLASGDREFILDIVITFVEQIPIQVGEIEKALSSEDFKALAAGAHKIKPSLALMGIDTLKEIIREIELYSKELNNLEEIPSLVEQLNIVTKNAISEMKSDFKL